MAKATRLPAKERKKRLNRAFELIAEGKNTRQAAKATGLTWQYISHHMKEEAPKAEITLDMIERVIIDRFEQAAKVPALEEEVLRLKNINAALENTNELLKRKVDEQDSRKKQFRLAQQQGEVKLPLKAR